MSFVMARLCFSKQNDRSGLEYKNKYLMQCGMYVGNGWRKFPRCFPDVEDKRVVRAASGGITAANKVGAAGISAARLGRRQRLLLAS